MGKAPRGIYLSMVPTGVQSTRRMISCGCWSAFLFLLLLLLLLLSLPPPPPFPFPFPLPLLLPLLLESKASRLTSPLALSAPMLALLMFSRSAARDCFAVAAGVTSVFSAPSCRL